MRNGAGVCHAGVKRDGERKQLTQMARGVRMCELSETNVSVILMQYEKKVSEKVVYSAHMPELVARDMIIIHTNISCKSER